MTASLRRARDVLSPSLADLVPRPGAMPVDEPPPSLDLRSASAVLAWADARRVRHLLSASAVAVLRRHGGHPVGRLLPATHTVMQVLIDDPEVRAWWGTGWARRLVEALGAAVAAEARWRAYTQEAEEWRAEPPREPVLFALWERVRTEREARVGLAPPSLGRPARPSDATVLADPPGLAWEGVEGCRAGPRVRVSLLVTARGLRVSCGCPGGPGPRCRAATDLLDRTLDLLCRPEGRGTRARLAEALQVPAWQRGLDALDAVFRDLGLAESTPVLHDATRGPTWETRAPRSGWCLHPLDRGGWAVAPAWVSSGEGGALSTSPRAWSEVERPPRQPQDTALLRLLEPGLRDGRTPATGAQLLALAGHPSVVVEGGDPVTVRAGCLGLAWRATPAGGVQVTLRDGDRSLVAADVSRMLQDLADPPGPLVHHDARAGILTVFDVSPGVAAVVGGLLARGLTFPPDAVVPLLSRVAALSRLLPVHLDGALRGHEVTADVRPVVQLALLADQGVEVAVRVRPLPEGEALPPGRGPTDLFAERDGERVFVQRGLAAEAGAVRRALAPVLPDLDLPLDAWEVRVPPGDPALSLVSALQDAAATGAVVVEWTRGALAVVGTAEPDGLRIQVGDGPDWLGLGGGVQVDALSVDVARLLLALRAGRRFVQVDGGDWVRLSQRLRDALAPLVDQVLDDGQGGVLVSPHCAPALCAAEDAGATIEAPAILRLERARVAGATDLDRAPPEGLRATLRPYQVEGQAWLHRLAHWAPGACLADDMGLGKTLQALTLLLRRAELGPALVVAPTSLGFNWMEEARRFAPSLRVLAYRGPERDRLLAHAGPGQVLVTSYELLVRDAPALQALPLATLVLDEAQAIKNPDTRRARAVRGLERGFTLALTGTPLENRTGELWSLFQAVAPGLLRSRGWFRSAFAVPIERDRDAAARAHLSALIAPFLLRRTKDQVAPELPARTEQVVRVELNPRHRRLYDAARQEFLDRIADAEGPARRFLVLQALTCLRQLACHPRLVDRSSEVPATKQAALVARARELAEEGHKLLVFSQFTRHLDLAAEALGRAGLRLLDLRGSTPPTTRQARVAAFQRGEADAFLISLRAGGTGLNLTAATAVLHLDPWWNPAVEDQATDRAHRIGQTRPVNVLRLVAADTVEDGILALHADKRALARGILDGAAGAAALSVDELVALVAT